MVLQSFDDADPLQRLARTARIIRAQEVHQHGDGVRQVHLTSQLDDPPSQPAHQAGVFAAVLPIVSGSAEMAVCGETVLLGRGDTIAIHPRELHSMTNRGGEDFEYVVFGITGNKGGKTVLV